MGDRLRLTVDGVIFQLQTYGGISRLFSEILPRMCDQFPRLYITLLTEGKLQQDPPLHERISNRAIPDVGRYLHPDGYGSLPHRSSDAL